MKLNWFSPLPPARSAIATYAAAVLPELGRHAEVTVWSETPSVSSPAALEQPDVRTYRVQAPPWEEINRADVSIYHIGNHALFHAGIWDLSRRHPGIVVLHDARLQELVAACAGLANDGETYLAIMRRYHGARGEAAAADVWSGAVPAAELVVPFPLTGPFVDRALGTVVHSANALGLVEAHTSGPILCTVLPYEPTRASSAEREWRPPFRLIMFGFLGGDRGLESVLAALGALPERNAFHLDIYGELPESERWLARVHTAGLAGHVTLHGFVPTATLETALAHAHLALNLRSPSRGEASFSLLHAWDYALPVVVNSIGAFTEIPATCVAFAQPDTARDDVTRHLRALLADPDAYRRMGTAAREHLLRHHSPALYAERLARFAARAVANRNLSNALLMADRAAAALRAVAGARVDEQMLRRIAAVILGMTVERRAR